MEEVRDFEITDAEGGVKKYRIVKPTNEDLMQAEFEYSKEFNHAIMNGIVPQAKLEVVLKENGVWTEENDEAIIDQTTLVQDLEIKLADADGEEERHALATELRQERDALVGLRQSRGQIFSHTAESKADSAQRDFLVARTTQFRNGGKVWGELKKFRAENNAALVYKATYEYITFINGVAENFMEELPESKILDSESEDAEEAA